MFSIIFAASATLILGALCTPAPTTSSYVFAICSAEQIAKTYELVVGAGVHRAPSIKVAEAAKIIENTQRDVNIALINELSIIFNKLNINTFDVLKHIKRIDI